MDFIVDTDVTSMLCKIGRIELLKKIFPNSKFHITQETVKELERAKERGFDYLGEIVHVMDLINLDEDVLKKGREISENNRRLHLTEICGILMCRKKGNVMLTNDKAAKQFCENHDVVWMDIVELLRFGFLKQEITENECWEIIWEIEEKDKTRIRNAERIFEKK